MKTRTRMYCTTLSAFLSIPFMVLYSVTTLACKPVEDDARIKSAAEKIADATLVVSGKVIERLDQVSANRYLAKIEVTKYLKGTGRKVLEVKNLTLDPCPSMDNLPLAVGEWWTLYIHGVANETAVVASKETLCATGDRAIAARPGHCQRKLVRGFNVGRLTLAPNSQVILGPDRDLKTLWSVTLGAGSTFDGVQFPEGTLITPRENELTLPKALSIGALQLSGRIRHSNLSDYNNPVSNNPYFSSVDRNDGNGRNLMLFGAEADSVYYSVPGPVITEARFIRPAFLKGFHISEYARFAADGNLTEFQSARDQVVNGRKIKKCDVVRLHLGLIIQSPFENRCESR